MYTYFSKARNETSEAMKPAVKEANVSEKTNLDKIRAVAKAYFTKREFSAQEAVYLW